MKKVTLLTLASLLLNCNATDDWKSTVEGSTGTISSNNTCADATYGNWQDSNYVLPYPVGKTYDTGLTHCSGSYHSPGQPDQFAIDFNMPINTEITASRPGTVVFIEQNGEDYAFPNNKIIVKHSDGTYAQYMHLTKNGALVTAGQSVVRGSVVGLSGATGLAGYPHLHFVVTNDTSWEYPYTSIPVNFSNTSENPRSLLQGISYKALPY